MNRRNLIIAVCATLLITGAFTLSFTRGPKEPTYQGKPLSHIFRQDISAEEFYDTLNHIGTNSFPYLVKWIREWNRPEPAIKTRYVALLNKLPAWTWKILPKPSTQSPSERASLVANSAFGYYKERAACTVPELLEIADSDTTDLTGLGRSGFAQLALESMGKGILPELYEGMKKGSPTSALVIHKIINSENFGTYQSAEVIRVLGQLTAHRNDEIAVDSISRLCLTSASPDVLVPVFTKALDDQRPTIRALAIQALARFGPKALPAAEKIRGQLQNPDPFVKIAAAQALEAIEPQPQEVHQ